MSGDLAVMAHGYRETTAHPAILIRLDHLQRFKETYLEYGYGERGDDSLGFRDTEWGVDFAVHVVGVYPGTGRPNAVRFLTPEDVVTGVDGIPYMSLALLLKTKLAICSADPHAYRHMADVIGLIRANHLPSNYDEKLDPCVASHYHRFWKLAQIEDDF